LTGKSPFNLSFGQQEKTAFAAILASNPDLIILDEPTQGLDQINRKTIAGIINKIRAAGKGLIIISHNLNFLRELTDRIFLLHNGTLETA
jgi:energy-coupling factor transporter ATP-binding protein EcfA2